MTAFAKSPTSANSRPASRIPDVLALLSTGSATLSPGFHKATARRVITFCQLRLNISHGTCLATLRPLVNFYSLEHGPQGLDTSLG